MIFIRVVGSWFPSFQAHSMYRFIFHYTEPYLSFFRKMIPPIGGVLDLSPIIGFIVLSFLEKLILGLIG